jgi:tRNA(Ile)-lysidine synthase
VAGPPAAVAAVRLAVRRTLTELTASVGPVPHGPAPLVFVAASGGPDSMALAAAAAFEAPKAGVRAGLLTVDHAWAPGSRDRAEQLAGLARGLGLDPVDVLDAPSPRQEGPARELRRTALLEACAQAGACALLLGHSLDDQAETVLLRLARGSGSRSLAGMPAVDGLVRRPLLGLRRAELRTSCEALGLPVWDDPANADPAFLRSRVRSELLPVLTDVLGPGAVPALARTAALLRVDADGLDAAASRVLAGADPLEVARLRELDAAVRRRVLRSSAISAGAPPTDLSAGHVADLDRLVTDWRGQGPLSLPGGLVAGRRDGRIAFVPVRTAGAADGPDAEERLLG